MSVKAQITGNQTWGTAPTSYTVYVIEVQRHGQKWNLYRRYSNFASLHTALMQEYGASKLAELQLNLPEKDLLTVAPLVFSETIIAKRQTLFNDYLQKVVAQAGWCESSAGAKTFFDFDNMGASGMSVELGAGKILKQCFCQVKYASNTLLDYWKHAYVVLSKAGKVYALKSMYDRSPQAIAIVDLKATNVQVSGQLMMKCIVDIAIRSFDSTMHLQIKLVSNEEYMSWVRSAADLTTSIDRVDSTRTKDTNSNSITSTTKNYIAQTYNNVTAPKQQAQPQAAPQKDQGAADELSAMYGI